MKKLISIALMLALAFSLSTTAFAATINQDSNPKKTEATITASITPTYTVTIPSDTSVAFEATSTDFGKIEATAVQIEPDKKISVSVTAGDLANSVDSAKKIPYTIKSGDTAFTSLDILNVGDKAELTIDIAASDWNAAAAGAYSGKVTFTLAYVAK